HVPPLRLPPPPIPTLFPYTTLFRSYNPVGTSAFSNMASGTTSAGTSELSGAFASNEVIVSGLGQTVGWSATLGAPLTDTITSFRSEEHTSELQSRSDLVCRLLLEKN